MRDNHSAAEKIKEIKRDQSSEMYESVANALLPAHPLTRWISSLISLCPT